MTVAVKSILRLPCCCLLDPVTHAMNSPKNDPRTSTSARLTAVTEGTKPLGTATNHPTAAGATSGGDEKPSAPVATPQYAFRNTAPVAILPPPQRTVIVTEQGTFNRIKALL